ncbi:hypothetical protein ACK3TF_004916 [Chlorella vulgaris]
METIPHMHYMYASQYWLNQALRNATGVLTDNIDKACLVWVDTYCYNQWYVSWRAVKNRPHIQKLYPSPAGLDVEQLLTQAVDHILDSPRFKKRQGRDYVFHTPLTNPGKAYKRMCTDMLYSHTLVVEHPLSCINKGRPKVSLRETQILPYSAVANAGDLSAPIVGSLRPTFMYMQANCGTAQCGMLMRLTIAEALAGSPADVQVKCANRPVRQPKPHAQVQLEMRRSVLCLLVPGDNVSSGRLTEAILAGCIPVFIGDPWHELPFNHGEVEWPNIAVFIKVQSPGWTNATTCAAPLKQWNQKADVTYATATVASLDAAFAYLRALPKEAIERRQAALERERTKFMYAAPPGRDSSALSDIVFTNLLGYGRRLLETPMLQRLRAPRLVAVRAAAADDPWKVLGVPKGADTNAVQRAYKLRMSEVRGRDEAAQQQIEAAHSAIMMAALSSRLKGNVSVEKDVLYADRAKYFPWRPRLWMAAKDILLYSALAQALMLSWALLSPLTAGTQPVIWCEWCRLGVVIMFYHLLECCTFCGRLPKLMTPVVGIYSVACVMFDAAAAIAGGAGNIVKQNRLYPVPKGGPDFPPDEKKQGGKNIVRGFFLAFLATFIGCIFFYTLPDAIAAALGRVMPFWFYEGQTMLLAIGSCTMNWLFTAFTC